MHPDLQVSDFGEGQHRVPVVPWPTRVSQSKARLRIGERVVAALSLESRVAGRLAVSDAPEKGGKGFVQAAQHVLQDLAVDVLVGRVGHFDLCQLSGLLAEYPKLLRRIW